MSFEQIVVSYSKLIYTICYRLTNDAYEAENLAQDTFLSAYQNMSKLKQNPKSYLTVIAANKCRDYLKSSEHKRLVFKDEIENRGFADPEQEVQLKMLKEEIVTAVDGLDEPYRTVARLHYINDCSFDEISSRLGRDKKTVASQAYRARDKLKIIVRGWKDDCI